HPRRLAEWRFGLRRFESAADSRVARAKRWARSDTTRPCRRGRRIRDDGLARECRSPRDARRLCPRASYLEEWRGHDNDGTGSGTLRDKNSPRRRGGRWEDAID